MKVFRPKNDCRQPALVCRLWKVAGVESHKIIEASSYRFAHGLADGRALSKKNRIVMHLDRLLVGLVLAMVLYPVSRVVLAQAADDPLAKRFDRPDLDNIVQVVSAGDAAITVYGSVPAGSLWLFPRDTVIYTAGTSRASYFYPPLPTHHSVLQCRGNKCYDLDNSQPVRVAITGLRPSTTYYYRFNDSAELVRIQTHPSPGTFAPFQFTLTGDSQGPYDPTGDQFLNKDRNALGPWSTINDAANFQFNITTDAMRRHVSSDFSISIGDDVEDGRYTVQWEREFFGWLKYYLTHAPVYMAMGNHEFHDPRCWRFLELPLSDGERTDQEYGPETIKAHLTERALSKTENRSARTPALVKSDQRVGNSAYRPNTGHKQIVSRNAPLGRISFMAAIDEDLWQYQRQWLEEELERNNDKKYVFVFSHHPFCYCGPVRRIRVGERGFDKLFVKHRVTAAFSGQWHGFAHNRKADVHYFQIGALSDTVFRDYKRVRRRHLSFTVRALATR